MEIKDFLEIYCKIASVETMLNSLTPEQIISLFENLPETEKKEFIEAIGRVEEFTNKIAANIDMIIP